MDILLTKQVALSAQVTESFNTELGERDIGGEYNKMRMMKFFKECTDAVIKIIY